ncbi:ionotropic receptor 21a [Teleopsis dalmanni]|uniref:ionotropic receptor 21a n=1 Tax=Teleopsis dalmanni TaxID=139649 RepID=UPI0018CE422E|nr:ionotropic receptor 21a [Teleopsis dalmanni]
MQLYSEDQDEPDSCISRNLIQRLGLNKELFDLCDLQREPSSVKRHRRRVDTTFHGHPRTRGEVLGTKFHMSLYNFDQTNSLVTLINKIAEEYLAKCPPVIYYDSFVKKSDGMILETLFKTLPMTFYHGEIDPHYKLLNPLLQRRLDVNCKSYILFMSDPLMTRQIIGPQTESRVVLVARSSQWKLRDFLASEKSSNIENLLVVGESLTADPLRERPYVLYTHKLYTDGLGSNTPIVLTSWIKGALSRPHINLFPQKFSNGFAGHRFRVSAVNQPPFIFSTRFLDMGGISNTRWDGVELRLLNIISKKLNFSIDITETPKKLGSKSLVDAIQEQIVKNNADIGMSGVYITEDRLRDTDMSVGHSRDCAAFITLASKALPKYRAIMGPFQWPVWVALIGVYLGAIFPIVFTDRLTLSHLIGNWGEMENMFWYVFGMFTNSLTFSGKYSWGSSEKTSTRLLIGAYWFFTIIITACYTGSIIAFVTLPAFPDTVDSVLDLLGLFFRVGTLDNGGWESWFQNSTHFSTAKLYRKMEFVGSFEEGIGNVTQSFFWNYAFLGSKAQLEYLVQKNFSDENISRRSALHLSEECFALFQVGYLFPRDSVYKRKIDSMILLAQQSGLLEKISNEVKWAMQRSSSGKLLQASSANPLRERIQEERQLTTADTEGMFLLMGIGYLLGAIALISEIVGGITNKCRQIIKRSRRLSTSWSSRNSSAVDGEVRTKAEQKAHDKRKAARRKAIEDEDKKNRGFGMREFNLTKTTLKELYGNYYKQQPNYVYKNGQLILETETISTGSTDCNFDCSNGEEATNTTSCDKKLTLHCKSEEMVLANIEIHQSITENDINDTLAELDNCLSEYHANDVVENEPLELQNEDEVVIRKIDEHSLFGSFVEMNSDEAKKENSLDLFEDKQN